MLTLLYTRITELAASPRAVWWLVIVAMAEASVFPLPVDLMLVPMLLANRERAWFLALVCTLASVAGGLIGWVLGAFLMEHIGMPIAHFYHADQRILNLEAMFRHYGVWIILAKGLTPLPYKFVTLAAGAAHFSCCPSSPPASSPVVPASSSKPRCSARSANPSATSLKSVWPSSSSQS